VRHRRDGRLRVPGLDTSNRQACILEAEVQPLRQRAGFKADALERPLQPKQLISNRLRIG
jgi:hypothetical protein